MSFLEARSLVLREVMSRRLLPAVETIALDSCLGRVLAEDARADREYPPFNRAMRDGFALRASEIPGHLKVIGEVRAGDHFGGTVGSGDAVEIMTGAPVPDGADAVVMVEHCTRHGDGTISTDRSIQTGANISPTGCEARAGDPALRRGARLDHTGIAWLATTGHSKVSVFQKPRVAIVATGDEIVAVEDVPAPHQIRNSNAYALAAQVTRAGGIPILLPVARDEPGATRQIIEQALKSDILLLSGGVSAGKYDIVEAVLAEMGAHFFFDRVLIQPGQPLVFGIVNDRFFFGLPGNPASTMVTFELFGRAALDLISGANDAPLPLTLARLSRPFRHKPGLTRFLPAKISCTEVTPVDWQGSGDIPALCEANAFLVADANRLDYAPGDLIPVLLK
jgi:molybdopterin molybdotransferase